MSMKSVLSAGKGCGTDGARTQIVIITGIRRTMMTMSNAPQYKIIAERNDYVLVEGTPPGFYLFGHKCNLRCPWGFPVDQCGSKSEVVSVLTSWKNGIDADNPIIQEVEDYFIGVLNERG